MIDKPAATDYEISDLLARRWSRRAFSDRPVERETLCRLFEAARWAPSSGNAQEWSFLFATREDAAEHAKLASILNPGNAWAHHAPVLGLSIASLDRAPGKPNRHAWHDVGLATENFLIQATAMGMSGHFMGGFSPEKAREVFEIPERYDPVAAFAVGYPGDPETLPDDLREREFAPRTRKPIREFVFRGKFGQRFFPSDSE